MPSSPDIVSLGEAMVEFASPEPGPLRDARRFDVGWGGDTSNFAVAVARLGGQVGYVTQLGDDEFAESLLGLWRREGVDTTAVRRIGDAFTAAYFLSRGTDGAHGFNYFREGSAAARMQAEDVPVDYIRGARAFHTSGITQAISDGACDASFRALEEARDASVLTTYDPNLRLKLWSVDRARAIVLHTIGQIDVALPNLDEARLLTGLDEPVAAAESLLERGPTAVVVKLGEEGALVADADGARRIRGYSVKVVDSAGAGDTFDAAFVVGLLAGESVDEAADLANAAAALTTTGLGCVVPIPTRAEVDGIRIDAGARTIGT